MKELLAENAILLMQSGGGNNFFSTLTIGGVAAAVVALLYIISTSFQNNYKSRQDYIEIQNLKLKDVSEDLKTVRFENEQLQKKIEELEEEYSELLEDKVVLMREHHQLLELSSADLRRVTKLTKLLAEVETELNHYRGEKGLPHSKHSLHLDDE